MARGWDWELGTQYVYKVSPQSHPLYMSSLLTLYHYPLLSS